MADLLTNLTAVKQGLAAAVTTIPGMQALHYPAPLITPPFCCPGPMSFDLDSAGPSTVDELSITWRCYAAAATAEGDGYDLMDQYMAPTGANSVTAAILADKTLGGVCLTLRCERWNGPGIATVGTVQYIAAELTVAVF